MFNVVDYFLYPRLLRLADNARDACAWESAADLYARVVEIRPKQSDIWVQHGNVAKPAAGTAVYRLPWRKVVRQKVPDPAGARKVQDGLDEVTRRRLAETADMLGLRD